MMRILVSIALLGVLAACETVEGFGEDVQAGGEVIEESAREVQRGQ